MPTNPIIPKRNSTAGNATGPQASALQLGEIATNTSTGTLFLKKEDGTVEKFGSFNKTLVVGIDAQTIQGCIDLVSGATASNQTQILIPPGVYNENLTLKVCVSLAATGGNNGQSSVVRINGTHSLTGGATAADNIIQLCGLRLDSTSSSSPTLSLAASGAPGLLVHLQDCMVGNTSTSTTSVGVLVGANVVLKCANVKSLGNSTAGQGGIHFDINGGSLYGSNLSTEFGTNALTLRGTNGALKPYVELKWSSLSCSGSNLVNITSNTALLTAGWSLFENLATTGNGVNIAAGSVIGVFDSTFAIKAGASNYVVTGAAGSAYYSFSNSYSNATGAPYETKIGSNVAQLLYSSSLPSAITALTGDVTASGTGSVAATLANSGVTAGSYGGANAVPVLTIDAKGRITNASTAAVSSGGMTTPVLTSITGNGSTTTFNINGYTSNEAKNYLVVLGGVPQSPDGTAYTINNGQIIFSAAPANGVTGYVVAYQASITPSNNFAVETKTATAGQTLFTLTSATYTPSSGSLRVFRNGLLLTPGDDYAETTSSSITLTSGAAVGDQFVFLVGRIANDSTVYQFAATGSVSRGVASKLAEFVSVKDFGAVGDGTIADNTAFDAMASAVGYVVVPRGDFLLTTTYIDVPIFFTEGGAIKVNAFNIITLRNRISSSKQQIFKGEGDIRFGLNGNFGEDSKHAHAAWWGIFPIGQANTSQTAVFNKALAAYTSLPLREGTFELDIGSYRLDGTIFIPRGVHFKGAGTRLTIFDLIGDNYNAIETSVGGTACRITGIQFERPIGSESYFNGAQIKLNTGTHMVDDVRFQSAKIGIEVTETATHARITRIAGFYNEQPAGGYPADSAMIWVKGDSCQIDNVSLVSTAYGPASIVLAGYNSTSSVVDLTISNVQHSEKSRGVKLWATSNISIINVFINGVVFFGDDALNVNSLIDITTESSAIVSNVIIEGVTSNNKADNLLTINQGSSEYCENITFASGSANSSSVKAATLTRTLGEVRNIVIGDGVNANLNATPVVQIGTPTYFQNIYISPRLTPRVAQPSYNWYFSQLPNDTATSISTGNFIFSGAIIVTVGTTQYGMYAVRAASTSPAITQMITPSANINATTGTLAGNTGTSGKFTVSVATDGKIYLENRLGSAQNVNITLMSASS